MSGALIGCLDWQTSRHIRAIARRLEARLQSLVAIYVCGSAVLGDFHPGRSDVDLVAVCVDRVGPASSRRLARMVRKACSRWAIGVDLSVMTTEAAAESSDPWYEFHLNTSVDVERHFGEEPLARWLHIYIANCRRYGATIVGPPATEVFAPVPRPRLLEVLLEQTQMESGWRQPHVRVLNACRTWRYLSENAFCSRSAGGRWALPRLPDGRLVSACLEQENDGAGPELDEGAVEMFRTGIADRVRQALEL